VPENDFYLDPWIPYINIGTDHDGRSHYEEGVSASPQGARVITEGFQRIFSQINS